jgi:hypothetical protein
MRGRSRGAPEGKPQDSMIWPGVIVASIALPAPAKEKKGKAQLELAPAKLGPCNTRRCVLRVRHTGERRLPILAPRERHRQGTGASYPERWRCVSWLGASMVAQTPSRLPLEDFEPGSVFGPVTGDPDPVTPSRGRGVPVCNRDLLPADSPAYCLGAWPPLSSPFLFCGVLPWPNLRPDTNPPPPLLPAARRLRPRPRPTAGPTAGARPVPRSRAKPCVSGRLPTSKPCPCNIPTPPASTSVPAPTGSASASPPKPLPA